MKKLSRHIGIDIGGTKILLQAFNSKMELVDEEKVSTQTKKGQKGFVEQLMSLIETYFHSTVESIGVAVPGIVDQNKGVLVKAPHLPVKRLKLKEELERRFKCKIHIENDANAFLYAQSQQPQLQKYKNLIAVMPGTGLGGAMMVDGALVHGKNGFAGELAHIILRADSALDTFEKNTSGAWIPKIAKALGIKEKFTPYDLATSSTASKKVKKHLVKHLGLGLASLNLIFNPDAFVMGGSIYELFLKDSKKELQKFIADRALNKKSPPILDAQLKYSVAMGVALLGLSLKNK